MNIVVAIDSLKGSLTSLEAGVAIKQGIEKVYPNAGVTIRPLADGGEGTVEDWKMFLLRVLSVNR